MNASIPLSTLPEPGCARCGGEVAAALRSLPGVRTASLDEDGGTLRVEFDESAWDRERLAAEARDLAKRISSRVAHKAVWVAGMDCPGCAVGISKAAMRVPGVAWAAVEFGAGRMLLEGTLPALEQARAAVGKLGYRLSDTPPAARPAGAPRASAFAGLRTGPGALALLGSLPLAAGFAFQLANRAMPATALFAASLAITGLPTLVRGARIAWTARTPDMFLLMALACGGAAALGDWSEAATAMALFAFGNALEAFTHSRARDAVRGAVALAPRDALAKRDGREERVPVESLRPGDLVIARPSERIPADGTVESGESWANEAMITGESAPAEKRAGSAVYAGSLNGTGRLEIRVTRAATDATLTRILDMVETAQARRAPSQRFIDTFARIYTPLVILAAAAVALAPPLFLDAAWVPWLTRAMTLLVVACPCALIISTPASIAAAIAAASRNGVLFKGGAALESLARVRAVAFDKTGTLTEGVLELTDAVPLALDERELLSRAAVATSAGGHPLARAVIARAHASELRPAAARIVEALPGLGVKVEIDGAPHVFGSLRLLGEKAGEAARVVDRLEAEGRSCAVLADGKKTLGVFGFRDRIRAGAAAALEDLRAAGVNDLVMLTGDSERAAHAAARDLPLTGIRAGLLPAEKVAAVGDLRRSRGRLAMVGDGVNDAPALAAADVGIAMGAAGSDAALETADVALMSDDLRRIPFAVRLGRRTVGIIRQNVAASLAFKLAFVGLAAAGFATLWSAVAADVGVSLLVTLNSMRLLRSGA